MSESNDSDLLLMGHVASPHGLAGWLKLQSFSRPFDAIFDYQPWTLRQSGADRPAKVAEFRAQGRGVVFRLVGVDDRSAAEALQGAEIWVSRSALPAAAPDEYSWADLEGLAASTVDGVDLGRVSHLLATGSNDVLVIKGDRERLVPFVMGQFVQKVDLAAGTIVVDWDPDF
jgi:16S rRNA processing protein RimM